MKPALSQTWSCSEALVGREADTCIFRYAHLARGVAMPLGMARSTRVSPALLDYRLVYEVCDAGAVIVVVAVGEQ